MRRAVFRGMGTAFLVGTLCGVLPFASHAQAAPPVAAGTSPPPWRRDLDAARLLESSLSLTPGNDAAETEARASRLDQLYLDLAAKYPTQPAVQKEAGAYAWRREHVAEALALLLRAQSLDARDADTADSLGAIYLHLGRTRDADGQFQRAVDARPGEARYHFALANVLYLFRNDLVDPPALPDADAVLAKSLEEFRLAASLAPQDLPYAQAYAETFYVFPHPDWEKALAAWESVRALSGRETDFADSHLARVSLRMKRPRKAEGYLDRIRDPGFDVLKAKLRGAAASLPPTPP